MSFKGLLLAGIGGTAAYVLIKAAQAEQQTQEPQIIYVKQPTNSGSNKGALLGAIFGLAANVLNQNGQQVFGSVAAPQDGLPAGVNLTGNSGDQIGPGGVNFSALERQYGLPAGYLYRTAQIESSLNPNAQNPNSSAGGLFQFINSTARQYGLIDRFDPVQASDAAARLAADNARILKARLGRDPTAAELYLAHQQGAGGAARLLTNQSATAAGIVGPQAVALNGGNQNMTAGQFAAKWLNKFMGVS